MSTVIECRSTVEIVTDSLIELHERLIKVQFTYVRPELRELRADCLKKVEDAILSGDVSKFIVDGLCPILLMAYDCKV